MMCTCHSVLDVDEMDDDPYPEVLDENYEL